MEGNFFKSVKFIQTASAFANRKAYSLEVGQFSFINKMQPGKEIALYVSGDVGNLRFGIPDKFITQEARALYSRADNGLKLSLFPNPADANSIIKVSGLENLSGNLSVMDMQGNLILDLGNISVANKQEELSIPLNTNVLQSTNYYLQLSSGSRRSFLRFKKNKKMRSTRKIIVILAFLANGMVAYPQIQVGLELGANSTFGAKKISNAHFELSPKLGFSPMNIGAFIAITKDKNQFTLGYRGNALNGAYKVRQFDAPYLSATIGYTYVAHRYYLGYLHKWKGIGLGGNVSYYQYSGLGFGMSRTSTSDLPMTGSLKKDNNSAPKSFFVPAFEISYDIKIRKKFMIIASLEVPLWRFSGHNLNYESNLNNSQFQSINFTPSFHAIFLNFKIPLFTIGRGWDYFSKDPK